MLPLLSVEDEPLWSVDDVPVPVLVEDGLLVDDDDPLPIEPDDALSDDDELPVPADVPDWSELELELDELGLEVLLLSLAPVPAWLALDALESLPLAPVPAVFGDSLESDVPAEPAFWDVVSLEPLPMLPLPWVSVPLVAVEPLMLDPLSLELALVSLEPVPELCADEVSSEAVLLPVFANAPVAPTSARPPARIIE